MTDAIPTIDIRPDDWAIVRDILARHVPDREVWAFGSRATWTAKDYSDLDLVILGDHPLPPDIRAAMADDFSDSALPYKVDVVEWAGLGDGFKEIIRRDRVVVRDRPLASSGEVVRGARVTTWGAEISLEYGKGIRGYADAVGPYRVFGSNGPVGWTSEPLAPGPGVILGRKGAYRGVQFSKEPFFVIDTAYYVVPKSEMDMRWLYYAIIHHKLGEIDDGSPIPSTTRAAVYVRELCVPEVAEQKAIAAILGTLDDKIELNRRMNETLEAMARAIFKDWFVDFGPTRAKMEGRPPYLAPDIWSLFSDRLDDEGKPEGWSQKPLDKVADFLNGLALQKYPPNGGSSLPIIKIAQLRAASTASADLASSEIPKDYIVKDGDVLFSWSGSLLHRVWTAGRGALNQHLFKVTSEQFPKWFYFYWISEHMPSFQATAASKATTMGHIQRHHLTQASTFIGTHAVMKAADEIISPLFNRQFANDLESRTLAATRDFLLPKLMSGEVRIKDAEKVIGEAI